MTEAKHFQMTARVSECECDASRSLTPGGVLRLVQDVSTVHSDCLGLTAQLHQEHHTAFLLAKTAMQLERPIPAGSRLTLDTYPAQERAVFHRYTTLRLPDGDIAAAVDARWVLVDTDTRRILRRAPQGLPLHWEGLPVAATLDLSFPKPETPAPLGEEVACYSRCDQNHHLNNTRYADLACDCLPLDRLTREPLRRLVLLYHREIPLGERFSLMGGQADADGYYLEGLREGERCFEAFASFAPLPLPTLSL